MTGRALTPEEQERRDYWERVHILGDNRPPIKLQPKVRGDRRSLGFNIRTASGGKSAE